MSSRPNVERRARARELGITIGRYPTGRHNAITDVKGVAVGHSTLIRGEGELDPGTGPIRTGVTAIIPNPSWCWEQRVLASGFVLNGAGEVGGLMQVQEWGLIETPILLTNTMSVGACSDGMVELMVERYPTIGGRHDVIIPVVGECDDSWLNDAAGRHIRTEHVREAIGQAAGGRVPEGNVGAGTGMVTCDLSGGIGTASRKLPAQEGGWVVGVLVMSNFGRLADLRVGGMNLAPKLTSVGIPSPTRRIYGSIIVVVATNAPLSSHQLGRLGKRAALGIGRMGSYAAHGSGEVVIAFSTANTVPRQVKGMTYRIALLLDERCDPLYEAVIEATEEAILNALCMGRRMDGHSGHVAPAMPLDVLEQAWRTHQAQ